MGSEYRNVALQFQDEIQIALLCPSWPVCALLHDHFLKKLFWWVFLYGFTLYFSVFYDHLCLVFFGWIFYFFMLNYMYYKLLLCTLFISLFSILFFCIFISLLLHMNFYSVFYCFIFLYKLMLSNSCSLLFNVFILSNVT